jgi:serine/threonine protein kinase
VDVVLTWIEGISLAHYLENIRQGRRAPPAPGEVIRLIHGLAQAVCTLHRGQQIAHGDIQPPNVILTTSPSRLVLIDYGSAWTTESTVSRDEGDGHHRCYAAPELQGKGTPIAFLADQFSVSVLFFELLTLHLPYGDLGGKAGRPEFIARAKDSLVPPSQACDVCRELPRSLRDGIDRLALRGLALDPHDRYPNRSTWLNDLFEVSARFRLPPELSPVESVLTRVIGWFVRPRGSQ